ncbi:MAG: PAS domain-containing protein [Phycisphaerae bacterium]
MTCSTDTPVRDIESPFRIEELFFSTTDRKGIITFGNDIFVRVSRYAAAELLGKPHKIIRHPDMPAVAFWLVWSRLLNGQEVVAYVKNKAKDGSFYWVCAFIAPINNGFLSIRLKPSSPFFAHVQALYKQLREAEAAVEAKGGTRKEAMAVSRPMLESAVHSLGFGDYEELMHQILPAEVAARRAVLPRTESANSDAALSETLRRLTLDCNALKSTVGGLLNSVDSFLQLGRRLSSEGENVRKLGSHLQLLSLNAQIRAATLTAQGGALQVIAHQMSRTTRGVSDSARNVVNVITSAIRTLNAAAFHITTGELSLEMMSSFLGELAADKDPSRIAGMHQNIAQLAHVVRESLQQSTALAGKSNACTSSLTRQFADFSKELRTLEILDVTGRMEAVRTGNESAISAVFDEMKTLTLESRRKLITISEEAAVAAVTPPSAEAIDRHLVALSAP